MKGCFTLKAVVWSDETHSKIIEPFDWCAAKDVEVEPGAQYARSTLETMADRMSDYFTGTTRTEGPRPPDSLIPKDRATQDLQAKNSRYGVGDMNEDISSLFGLMFANLRYAMGENLEDGDFRVWIVSIH